MDRIIINGYTNPILSESITDVVIAGVSESDMVNVKGAFIARRMGIPVDYNICNIIGLDFINNTVKIPTANIEYPMKDGDGLWVIYTDGEGDQQIKQFKMQVVYDTWVWTNLYASSTAEGNKIILNNQEFTGILTEFKVGDTVYIDNMVDNSDYNNEPLVIETIGEGEDPEDTDITFVGVDFTFEELDTDVTLTTTDESEAYVTLVSGDSTDLSGLSGYMLLSKTNEQHIATVVKPVDMNINKFQIRQIIPIDTVYTAPIPTPPPVPLATAVSTIPGSLSTPYTGEDITPLSEKEYTLTWQAVAGATSYQVEWIKYNGTINYNVTTSNLTTNVTWQGSSPEIVWKWRVRAVNAETIGDWSDYRFFGVTSLPV